MPKHRRPVSVSPWRLAVGAGLTVATAALVTVHVLPAGEQHVNSAPTRLQREAATAFVLPQIPLGTAAAVRYLTPLPPAPAVVPRPSAVATPSQLPAIAPPTPRATSVAAQALSAALGQVGTPYVYGGASPGGFDCSGLVMWAYRHAGISLPRTATAQASAGRAISLSELQPGDMIFFYQPIEHVVIYIGNGKIVEASQPGVPVHVRSMYLQGFAVARRVTG